VGIRFELPTARGDCPPAEEVVSFVLEELDPERELALAGHLAGCEICCRRVERVREGRRLLDLWTARAHGAAAREAWQDRVAAAAAAAPERGPVEVTTDDGRYRLGLYPERSGTRWLLVVRPRFGCPEGAEVVVRDSERVWLRARVASGCASGLLSQRPDLGRLVVSCVTEPPLTGENPDA